MARTNLKAYTLGEFLRWNPPIHRDIISSGILPEQARLIISAKRKSWKSMIAMHTGMCIATGQSWFGYPTVKSKVLMLNAEVADFQYQRRLLKYWRGQGNKHIPADDDEILSNLILVHDLKLKIDKGWGFSDMTAMIDKHKPKVVIIDPVNRTISGRQTDEYDVNKYLDNCNQWIQDYGVSIILVHHNRQTQLHEGMALDMGSDDIFGSSMFPNWMDGGVAINAISDVEEYDGKVLIRFRDIRNAERFLKPMLWEVDRDTLQWHELEWNPELAEILKRGRP